MPSRNFSFRRLYGSAVAYSGLAALQRARLRDRIVILAYHDMDAPTFKRHLEFLARTYNIVSLTKAVRAIKHGEALPQRALVLTFDDGFRSFYTAVYPALRQFQSPATVFLTTGYIGSKDIPWFSWIDLAFRTRADIAGLLPHSLRGAEWPSLRRSLMAYLKAVPDEERQSVVKGVIQRVQASDEEVDRYRLLTWDQVREMESTGLVSFGGHTRTHPILTRVDIDTARREVADCAADLKRELGPAARHFAYPNGTRADFNKQIQSIVREAGFASAVTIVRGTNGPGDDVFALRRIAVDGTLSVGELAAKVSGLWPLPGQGAA